MASLFGVQIVILLSVIADVCFGLMCLDENGNHVDWFSVYKSPKIHNSADKKLRDGLGQFYLDVHAPQWELSAQPISEKQHAVYNTLQQIYTPQGTLMYIMYNDEPPEGTSTNGGGHTKGVVAFDGTSGIWLVHSVPHFPPRQRDGYAYPSQGEDYGQTMLCMSLSYSQLGSVAQQLQYNQPDIYDHSVPDQFLAKFPTLKAVLDGTRPSGPPWRSVVNLSTVGGQEVTSFAKSDRFQADLYDSLVAPYLKQSLLVESWVRGHKLPSNCSAQYKVLNVKQVSLTSDVTFTETKDHAKWAVTKASGRGQRSEQLNGKNTIQMSVVDEPVTKWACVGDINRMDSQFHRGGGTVCVPDGGLWEAFNSIVERYESCG